MISLKRPSSKTNNEATVEFDETELTATDEALLTSIDTPRAPQIKNKRSMHL